MRMIGFSSIGRVCFGDTSGLSMPSSPSSLIKMSAASGALFGAPFGHLAAWPCKWGGWKNPRLKEVVGSVVGSLEAESLLLLGRGVEAHSPPPHHLALQAPLKVLAVPLNDTLGDHSVHALRVEQQPVHVE